MTEVPESFRDLGVSEPVAAALEARGITEPFPIQAMVWEDARSGRDTLARSKTGSGKTLGFALPIVDRLDPASTPLPAALVLVPTRELAQQVREDFRRSSRRGQDARHGGLRRHQRQGAGQGASSGRTC